MVRRRRACEPDRSGIRADLSYAAGETAALDRCGDTSRIFSAWMSTHLRAFRGFTSADARLSVDGRMARLLTRGLAGNPERRRVAAWW